MPLVLHTAWAFYELCCTSLDQLSACPGMLHSVGPMLSGCTFEQKVHGVTVCHRGTHNRTFEIAKVGLQLSLRTLDYSHYSGRFWKITWLANMRVTIQYLRNHGELRKESQGETSLPPVKISLQSNPKISSWATYALRLDMAYRFQTIGLLPFLVPKIPCNLFFLNFHESSNSSPRAARIPSIKMPHSKIKLSVHYL